MTGGRSFPSAEHVPVVLITGGDGQLGHALADHVWPTGWEPRALGRVALDVADEASVVRAMTEERPAAVVNAAAYTAVDRAETEPGAAWRVNALGPAVLAAACRAADVPLVHVSTDYVFDGAKDGAWEVGDPTAPLGVYGASKLGGEWAVRTACPRHAIVRTAWPVSAQALNFVTTMLRLAGERDHVRVVADQRGSPTAAADLAAALATVAVRLAEHPDAPTGSYHFANAGEASWAEFAAAIFAGAAARGGPSASVEPIATADYPTAARRPANSVLSTAALTRDYGIVPRAWQAALADILDDLYGART